MGEGMVNRAKAAFFLAVLPFLLVWAVFDAAFGTRGDRIRWREFLEIPGCVWELVWNGLLLGREVR